MPFVEDLKTELIDVPLSDLTSVTIDKMHALACNGGYDPEFRKLTNWLVKDSFTEQEKAKKLFDFAKRFIRYRRDPIHVELVYNPWVTLATREEDCDGFSVLLAAFGIALGIPYRFVTVAANPLMPDEFSHVYTEYYLGGKWVGVDASTRISYFGWTPNKYYKLKTWSP